MNARPDIRMLILGTGGMAGEHARQFSAMEGVKIVAGVDVDPARVTVFCDEFDIEHRFTDLGEAIEWGEFDAVANVTPDNVHHATSLQVLAAGKHVFCEKPLAVNYADALEMTEAAHDAERIAMVNLTYRNVSALQKARKMVLAGDIGDVRHVDASYLQSWLSAQHWGDWRTESKWLWRLSRDHGSNGVLGDVGIHILDFASYGAASDIVELDCRLKAFHKAENDQIGEYKLDANDSFVMTVEFANGALGTINASRWASGHANDLNLKIFGTLGGLEVIFAGKGADGLPITRLNACMGPDLQTQTWREIQLESVETNYQRFIRALREGDTLEPSFAHAAGLQRLLDIALEMEAPSVTRTQMAGE